MRARPVGRIGKPLERGEVRKISVLVRESETSKNLDRDQHQAVAAPLAEEMLADRLDIRKRTRGWATLGPIGVATHGIRMFERYSPTMPCRSRCRPSQP